ncbi:glycoside hydrolase family 88 protein [candidate division KSB1 bacterium]|nr:glycoside hydrolase family 88 protein [candidate division KSB1 bacterium]
MNKTFLPIFTIFFVSTCFAQMDNDETIIRKMADNVLAKTTFKYDAVGTEATYDSIDDIPEGMEVRFHDHYTEWGYLMGVMNIAMVHLGEQLNEEKYTNYPIKHVANGFNSYKYFQDRFKHDRPHYRWPYGQFWTMGSLDDCGAMAASVIEVYQMDKKKEYKAYIDKTADFIMHKQDRLTDGTLCRKTPHEMTVWADDMYMSVPFLARMGHLTGDAAYFDDALMQVFNFTKYLWSDEKQLFYHCYYDDLKRNGVAHWGRCNGWIVMSQCHLLELLPKDHPKREALRQNLERQILGLAKYQTAEGLWRQLIDKTDSYTESSGSAMFVYGVAKAVNEGWIDQRYASIALQGWNGLKEHKITPEGDLKDVCVGTNIDDSIVYYYNRPARTNETHGIGAVIDAGVEILKLKKTLERK